MSALLEAPVTNYFDEYQRLHEEMKRLRVEMDRYHILSDETEALRVQINELREQALGLIPYGATTPNKGSGGSRYGRKVER